MMAESTSSSCLTPVFVLIGDASVHLIQLRLFRLHLLHLLLYDRDVRPPRRHFVLMHLLFKAFISFQNRLVAAPVYCTLLFSVFYVYF